jgi:hypothetical protein
MNRLIKLFFEICLFRAGPQDVPASDLLLALSLAVYLLVDVAVSSLGLERAPGAPETNPCGAVRQRRHTGFDCLARGRLAGSYPGRWRNGASRGVTLVGTIVLESRRNRSYHAPCPGGAPSRGGLGRRDLSGGFTHPGQHLVRSRILIRGSFLREADARRIGGQGGVCG